MEPRSAWIALLMPLVAGLSLGQTQVHPAIDIAGVRALLKSPQLAEKAWGAYSAAQLRDRSLSESIVAQLRWAERLRDSSSGSEGYACIQSLLDSLIQLRAEVPIEAIVPYAGRWRPEALILLALRAANGGDEDVLLNIREENLSDAEWLTVNNLLLKLRSTALLLKMLREIHITHTFIVGDVRGEGFGFSFGRGSRPRVSLPPDFPPIGLYQLEIYQFGTFPPGPDDVLVIRGPLFGGPSWDPEGNRGDVLYRRTVVPAGGSAEQPGPNFRDTDRQLYRRAYLAEFGGITHQQAGLLFSPTTTVLSNSGGGFLKEAQSAMTSQGKAIVDFAMQAAKRNGVSSLNGLRLTIDPVIKDKRDPAGSTLPEIPPKDVILN